MNDDSEEWFELSGAVPARVWPSLVPGVAGAVGLLLFVITDNPLPFLVGGGWASVSNLMNEWKRRKLRRVRVRGDLFQIDLPGAADIVSEVVAADEIRGVSTEGKYLRLELADERSMLFRGRLSLEQTKEVIERASRRLTTPTRLPTQLAGPYRTESPVTPYAPEAPPSFVQGALAALLHADTPTMATLRKQLEYIVDITREDDWNHTRFVLRVAPEAPRDTAMGSVRIDDVIARIDGVEHPVRVALVVKSGTLDKLTCVPREGSLPADLERFAFSFVDGFSPTHRRITRL